MQAGVYCFPSRKVLSKRCRLWTSLGLSRLTAFSSKTTNSPRSVLRRFINSQFTPIIPLFPDPISAAACVFRLHFAPFQSPSFPFARTRSFSPSVFPHPLRSSSTPWPSFRPARSNKASLRSTEHTRVHLTRAHQCS